MVLTDTADNADIIFTGALTTGTLTTQAQQYDLFLNGGGTIGDATLINTGTLQIGTGTVTTTFNTAISATSQSAITLAGTVTTSDDVITLGDGDTGITLAQNTTITSGTAALNIGGTIAGNNKTLILNSTGVTTLSGDLTALTTLLTDAGGGTKLAAGVDITTTGTMTFND